MWRQTLRLWRKLIWQFVPKLAPLWLGFGAMSHPWQSHGHGLRHPKGWHCHNAPCHTHGKHARSPQRHLWGAFGRVAMWCHWAANQAAPTTSPLPNWGARPKQGGRLGQGRGPWGGATQGTCKQNWAQIKVSLTPRSVTGFGPRANPPMIWREILGMCQETHTDVLCQSDHHCGQNCGQNAPTTCCGCDAVENQIVRHK